jgi:hypothetical protein
LSSLNVINFESFRFKFCLFWVQRVVHFWPLIALLIQPVKFIVGGYVLSLLLLPYLIDTRDTPGILPKRNTDLINPRHAFYTSHAKYRPYKS